jgi:hypothetical protein
MSINVLKLLRPTKQKNPPTTVLSQSGKTFLKPSLHYGQIS